MPPSPPHLLRRWLALVPTSALLAGTLVAVHMPGAVLLGCMLAGIGFAVRGHSVRVPLGLVGTGQALLGCLMAQSLHADRLVEVWPHWPSMLATTVLLLAASTALGWWLMRRQVLPGSTAVWGMAPGAATAMVVMCESFGADVRLVAFMQYTRVVLVTAVAALVARAAGVAPAQTHAVLDWCGSYPPQQLAATLALVLGAAWLGRRFTLPGGALLLTLLAGSALQTLGWLHLSLPPVLMLLAYASIGWSVGLRFTPGILQHAVRALPRVLGAMLALMAVGLLSAGALVLFTGLDPLSAYLATSPGGADSMAVLAATSAVDTSFVMAMQLTRFLIVLLAGPALTRWVARRYG
jgi:hypothetical protein